MSVGRDGAYDFVLQDSEINPKIELGFILAEDEGGRKAWAEGRIPPLPPRRSSGPLDWTHKDPITDFVYSQSDWSSGAFQPYYDNEDQARYAKSDGVDLRWQGVAALGPRRGPIRTGGTVLSRIQSNVFLANGDWEEGQVVGWAAGASTTVTINTAVVRTGNYSGQMVVAQGAVAGTILTQSIPNPTVYRSRIVTVIAYVRRASGSDAGVFLRLNDGVSSTDSATVSADTWTYVTLTKTVDAGASALTLTLQTSATTTNAAHTFRMDDCYLIPAGGVQCMGTAIRTSTDPDEAYAAFGRCITRWSETTYAWEAVYIHGTTAITSLIEFDDDIYAGFGEVDGGNNNQYVYGTGTTWTVSAINATAGHQDNHARHWVKARNGFGQWVLWKSSASTTSGTERNTVAWSSSPTNVSGSWNPSSYFTVGTTDRHITGLYPFRDTFIVTKVDGIWVWDGIINDFVVVTPEWEHSLDAENGANGQLFHNDLYLSTIRQGFFRYGGNELEDLSPLLMAPRLTDFGGRVTAFTACARELIIGLDQPVADTTTTKTSRLVRLRLVGDRWQIHTTQEPEIGLIDALTLHRDTRLWAFGRTYDSNLADYIPSLNVWVEPTKVAAPFADATPSIESTGSFDTSIWHGGVPETSKAFIALTIWCEDLDSNHTIQVSYGRDGRAATDRILGIFNSTERVQTLLFKNVLSPKDNAIGRFIQLRFTFSTTNTVSPKLYAFALHTQLVPSPIRAFTVDAWVGGKTTLRTGVGHEQAKSDIEATFTELEAQIFPITLLDDFGQTHGGTGVDGSRVRQVRLTSFSRVPQDDTDQGQERWRLTMQEVAIS